MYHDDLCLISARINENPYDEEGDENIEFGDFDGDDDEIDDVSIMHSFQFVSSLNI